MLNDAGPIVPPMKNAVGNTHAETKFELAARARAEQAAQAADLAAREQKANKKSPVSTVLALVFGFLALGAGGFAVYELLENNKLQDELKTAKSSYADASARNDDLSATNSKLRRQNAALQQELDELKGTSEDGDKTEEEGEDTTDGSETTDDSDKKSTEDSDKTEDSSNTEKDKSSDTATN